MLSMSGCFTGIESTPKITASDVKREKVAVTEEDRYLDNVRHAPLDKWHEGKLFYVTDDKINLALEPSSTPSPRQGDLLSFSKYRTVPSLTGEADTELLFADSKGREVVYRLNSSPEELARRSQIEIPFTIELSVVDSTMKAIKGKKFYIRTSMWYDKDGKARNGLKFIPVEVMDVLPGNSVYPVMAKFRNPELDNGRPAYVFMSVGDSGNSSRNFASLFFLKDPHLKYPQISDENWRNIIHGRIVKYMTREECRLALGPPTSVDRRPGISTMHELWNYENGVYLIFDDGLLQSFRL